jgi:hypothetical protein
MLPGIAELFIKLNVPGALRLSRADTAPIPEPARPTPTGTHVSLAELRRQIDDLLAVVRRDSFEKSQTQNEGTAHA